MGEGIRKSCWSRRFMSASNSASDISPERRIESASSSKLSLNIVCSRRTSSPYRHRPFRADVGKSALAKLLRQSATIAHFDSAAGHHPIKRSDRLELFLRFINGRVRKNRQNVEFLDHNPTARFQRLDHSLQSEFSAEEVHQHQGACMCHIEFAFRT